MVALPKLRFGKGKPDGWCGPSPTSGVLTDDVLELEDALEGFGTEDITVDVCGCGGDGADDVTVGVIGGVGAAEDKNQVIKHETEFELYMILMKSCYLYMPIMNTI